MKLELIADSFYHRSGRNPHHKGDVLDLPESYITKFPNTFKPWEEPTAEPADKTDPETPESTDTAGPEGSDLLSKDDEPELIYSRTEISRMNGTELAKICPGIGINTAEYETVKALRRAVEIKLFNEGAV